MKSGDCKYQLLQNSGGHENWKKEKKIPKVLVISNKFEVFCTYMDSCRCTSPDGSEFCNLASASFIIHTGCSYVLLLVFPHNRELELVLASS